MPDWLKTLIGGSLVSAILLLLTYFFYYKPVLANQDAQIAQKDREIAASEKRAQQAERDRNDTRNQINTIKSQWQDARSTYLRPLTNTIRDANKTEKEWENKPHPSPRQFAEQIVKNRDALRDRITQMKADLDTIYTDLNGDIDAIRDALAQQPPVSDAELRRLIGRLHTSQWDDKVKLIEDLIQKTFLSLGCPQI
jgi:F0F1-type ATP synthase membrane subunit b/b'